MMRSGLRNCSVMFFVMMTVSYGIAGQILAGNFLAGEAVLVLMSVLAAAVVWIVLLLIRRRSPIKRGPYQAPKIERVWVEDGEGHMLVSAQHFTHVEQSLDLPRGTGQAIIILKNGLYQIDLGYSSPLYTPEFWTERWARTNNWTGKIGSSDDGGG